MMPGEQDVQAATGSSFWTTVIAVWLVLFAIAGTLALALAIWNLVKAF
jgi:hypothetical protein